MYSDLYRSQLEKSQPRRELPSNFNAPRGTYPPQAQVPSAPHRTEPHHPLPSGFPLPRAAAASAAPADPELEAFLESLQQKMYTSDDKIANLTKLLKLTQGLQDERDMELRKELDESRQRNRKLEQKVEDLRGLVVRLAEDHRGGLDTLRESVRAIQGEEVQSLNQRLAHCSRDLADLQTSTNERMQALTNDMQQRVQQWGTNLGERMQNEITTQLTTHSETVNLRMSSIQREVQAALDKQGQNANDSAMETDTAIKNLQREVEAYTTNQCTIVEDNCLGRIHALSEQLSGLHLSMSEYVHNYKEHASQNTQKTNEIYEALKQLLEVHETTRSVLSGDIEALKEWTTKTSQRLKTKLEMLATECRTVREQHIKLMSDMLKNKGAPTKDAILEILNQKSTEASAMVTKMDDELKRTGSVQRSYTSPPPQRQPVSTMPGGKSKGGDPGVAARNAFSTEAFLEKSKARRQQLDEMCSELAQLDNSLTQKPSAGPQRSSTRKGSQKLEGDQPEIVSEGKK